MGEQLPIMYETVSVHWAQLPFLTLLDLVAQEMDGQWCLPSYANAYLTQLTKEPQGPASLSPCRLREGANREILGIIVSYKVKVKLVVSRGG